MELLREAWELFIHLDRHLNGWAAQLGPWLYLVLFLIIFCETGLIVTPYLPGDSLLFAVGALASREGSPIRLSAVALLLIAAAVIGDAVNYAVGRWVGPKIFYSEESWWLNKKHLDRAHRFYEKYGGKTIFLALFVPIVRTFAPFVAGVGTMTYPRFAIYNVTGGATWVLSFVVAGYQFAELPVVKHQFHYVIVAIILISVMPMVIEYFRSRKEGPDSPPSPLQAPP